MRIDDIDALHYHGAVFLPQSGRGISGDHPVGHHPAPAASGTGAERHAVGAPDPPADLTAAYHRVYEQCLSIKRETKNSTACWIRKASRAARCVSACRAESQRDCPAGGAAGAEPAVSRTVAADRLRLERTAAAPAGKRRAGRHAGDGARPAKLRRGLQRAPAAVSLEVVPIMTGV